MHPADQFRQAAAFAVARRRNTASAVRAAKRHSRFVRIARVAVPVVSVVAIVAVTLLAWFSPLRLITDLPLSLRDVVISGTKIKMEQPRLSGFTGDARPYDLAAQSAAQDVSRPELIELTKLQAKIQMQDSTQVELSAETGLFDTKAQMLTLERDIVFKSSSGYEGRLSQAVINTRTGDIVSEKPVTLKMLNGTINANAMEIERAGGVIRFDSGVSMQLMPNKDQGNVRAQVPQ
jgi:lipopolysaccharide export system protein LptC